VATVEPPLRRLEALQQLIPMSAQSVADIGYDHGQLLRDLVLRRPHIRVIGVDKQQDAAQRFYREGGVSDRQDCDRVSLRRGDGLQPIAPGEVDIAVFSGLAERKIWELLGDGADALGGVSRLVFGPLTSLAYLRPRLREAGWRTVDENIVFTGGRYTLSFAVERGPETDFNSVTWHFGSMLFDRREPLLPGYLRDFQRRHHKAFLHVARQRPKFREMIGHWPAAMARCESFAGPSTSVAGVTLTFGRVGK